MSDENTDLQVGDAVVIEACGDCSLALLGVKDLAGHTAMVEGPDEFWRRVHETQAGCADHRVYRLRLASQAVTHGCEHALRRVARATRSRRRIARPITDEST